MDAQLAKVKKEVEADLGRPMNVGEEIETKALFYFAKGVALNKQMEHEKKSQHQGRFFSTVRDFMCCKGVFPKSRKVKQSKEGPGDE